MGTIWLFLWLLDKMTIIDHEIGEGKILGGKPIKYEEVNKDLEISERTYNRWLKMLRDEGYIKTTRTPYGLVIIVYKAFKIFNQRTVTDDVSTTKRSALDGISNIRGKADLYTREGGSNKTRQLDKTVDTNIDIPSGISIQKNKFSVGNPDINEVSSYFLYKLHIPKEDIASKDSRMYWSHLLKASKTGKQGVKWLIDIASEDEFWKNNITSSKNLYYNRIKLITRLRGKTTNGKNAFYSEGGGENVEIRAG